MILTLIVVLLLSILILRRDHYIVAENQCLQSDAPAWCPNEFSFAYSASAASETDRTFYDEETGQCNDGTRHCVYIEKYDDQRKLVGISNDQQQQFQFVDDLYNGQIELSEDTKKAFLNIFKVENDILYMKQNGKWYRLQVGVESKQTQQSLKESNDIIVITATQYIVYMSVYNKLMDKAKPTFVYSDINSGTTIAAYRSPSSS